jgi:hypothetical protein
MSLYIFFLWEFLHRDENSAGGEVLSGDHLLKTLVRILTQRALALDYVPS